MGKIYGKSYQLAREARLAFAEHRCEICRHDGAQYRLEAHHAGGADCYVKDRRDELRVQDVVVLCQRCHDLVTDRDRRERYAAREVRPIATVVSFVHRPPDAPVVTLVVPPTVHVSVQRSKPTRSVIMAFRKMRFFVRGDAPIMFHNGLLADPIYEGSKRIRKITAKAKKTDADFEELSRLEFTYSMYVDEQGEPIVPADVIRGCLIAGAKRLKSGIQAKAGLFVDRSATLLYDGPRDAAKLFADKAPSRRSTGIRSCGPGHAFRSGRLSSRWRSMTNCCRSKRSKTL